MIDQREYWEMPLHEFSKFAEATRIPKHSILATSPSLLTEDFLGQQSTKDLRTLAHVIACPHSDDRAKLIERILVWWSLRRRLGSETAENLRKLKGAELKALLKSVGVYVPQNKYGMANALIGWRDQSRLTGQALLAKANHYRHVRRAVRLGLPVPAEVLEPYRDLQSNPEEYPLFDKE